MTAIRRQQEKNRATALYLLEQSANALHAAQALYTSANTGRPAADTVLAGQRVRKLRDAVIAEHITLSSKGRAR